VTHYEILPFSIASCSHSAENRNVEFDLLVRDSAVAESVEATMTGKHGGVCELV
jgi:hypothetical protein